MTEALEDAAAVPLWAHQADAVETACRALADGPRCQVIMACGTGKTRVGAEVSARVAPGGKVLVVVPSLLLVSQTARAWAQALGDRAGMIAAVCSLTADATRVSALRDDMAHLGMEVSTSPERVSDWLRVPGRTTILATYQSLPVIAEASRLVPGFRWDLAVVDEAHRAAGRADRKWQAVNEDREIPAARRLYMTATPRVMESEKHEVASMDDAGMFGPEAFRLSFADAIARNLLADYRVAVTVVTDAEIAKRAADTGLILSARGRAVPADMLAQQVALLKACAKWDLRRVITYHRRVERSRRFAGTLLNAADLLSPEERPALIRAEHVDGTMRQWERDDVLRHLDAPGAHTVTVSNARVLAEGVDVPELDAVMFADPRDSGTDVVQAVGRALRKGGREGKTATLIVPLLLAGDETAEAALEGSSFDMVWRVIRALRAHDERLADWLDSHRVEVTTGKGPQGRGTDPPPDWLDVSGIPVSSAFAEALQVRMLTATTSSWTGGYAHAVAWHALHGHLDVPKDHVTGDGYPLGAWVAGQRSRRRNKNLSAAQIEKLNRLGMTWNVLDARWEEGLRHARAYRADHGDLNVLYTHECEDGFRLGQWLGKARADQRRGKLLPQRMASLDDLGIDWQVFDARWQSALEHAAAWREQYGNLDVPQDYETPGGFRLGAWISSQRTKRKKGKLGERQEAELTALGMRWDGDFWWERGIAAARRFHAGHGHLTIPKGYGEELGFNLEQWVHTRRRERRAGTLPPERIAALDELGMNWDPLGGNWERGLRALEAFRANYGDGPVPNDWRSPDGLNLGAWIDNRRSDWRRGKLAPERAVALEALGVVFDPHVQDWRDGLADCRDFHAEHGHLNIPGKARGQRIKALGVWLDRRRQEYRAGKLPADRAAALEELGVNWEGERGAARRRMHEALRAYVRETGSPDVPASHVTGDGLKLGAWMHNKKRTVRIGGKLHPETESLLRELGADWMVR